LPNPTEIPAPRVDFIDARTGKMAREWYLFLLNIFQIVGGDTGSTSIPDLQVGPDDSSVQSAIAELTDRVAGLELLPVLPAAISVEPAPSGTVAQVAVMLTGVPYGTQFAQVTVVDANIVPTSKIIVGWGNITDADENTPDFDDVRFTAVPAVGSMAVRLSCTDALHRLGGSYRINYLIG
jgi:hypothetical protein